MVLPWRDADADADGDYCRMTLRSNCVVPSMHVMVMVLRYSIADLQGQPNDNRKGRQTEGEREKGETKRKERRNAAACVL